MPFSGKTMQQTLRRPVTLTGVGVHKGNPVSLDLRPADPDSGIVFHGVDRADRAWAMRAGLDAVGSTNRSTSLGSLDGPCVVTVEHLLSAFSGLGVDNVHVDIDGAEVPIMDGSAADFVAAIDQAGIVAQSRRRRMIRVKQPVRVELDGAVAEFLPFDGRRFEAAISYDCATIGTQAYSVDLDPVAFRQNVAGARTFGYMKDVERLWAAGLALGASLENTVAIGDDGVVNPEGLRFSDEFVRHKILDSIGDLALAGAPIVGCYRSVRGGHALNVQAVGELLSQRDAWEWVSEDHAIERKDRFADILPGLIAPAYAPDRT